MRRRALGVLAATLLAVAGCAAPPEPPGSAEVDPLVSLARVYGVVRYFHPSDSLEQVDWDRFLVYAAQSMEGAASGREVATRLETLFGPVVEGFRVVPAGSATWRPSGDGPWVEWRHLGYGLDSAPRNEIFVSWRTHHKPVHASEANELYQEQREAAEKSAYDAPVLSLPVARGLVAQIPVSLPESATKVGTAQRQKLDRLAAVLNALRISDAGITRPEAAADGIAAWNIARHFYPYWDVVRIDWEGELRKWLAALPLRQSREELADDLRRLTAPLDDGHVRIIDPRNTAARLYLPISIRPVGNQWIVDATAIPERIRPGDVITEIGDQPIEAWYAERVKRVSGSEQFKRWRVRAGLMSGPKDSSIRLSLARGPERFQERLSYDRPRAVLAERPPAVHQVRPGIYYVDVTRIKTGAFEQSIETLANARGIVFDLRGTPTAESATVIPYWITGADTAKWMSLPLFDRPFGTWTRKWSTGWLEKRNEALSRPAKVLLVESLLISYSESLASYFPGQKVGLVVGERTGGANGNSVITTLPSGMNFYFTGMRVSRHDGSLLHLQGFKPDVEVVPTAEGLRAGRDEVLERGVELVSEARR